MAAHEQLILDILANTTQAERGIGSLSRTIHAADDDVLGLAKRLDDLGKKNAKAKVKLEGNTEAQAQLDKLDAKMLTIGHRLMEPKISVEGAARAAFELAAVSAEIDKVSKSGAKAAAPAGGLAALAGTGGGPPSGMAALIGAGVALSPVLITVGTGLAGLAAAAYGVAKPIENAAKKTGGLQANLKTLDPLERQVAVGILGLGKQYDAFQHALKPEVIGVFNQGLRIAGHLMHDVEPVAKATGRALGGLLASVDREFQSGTWQQFFGFMARTAGPDIKLLGQNFTDLLDALPPLIEKLQPLATGILHVSDAIFVMTRNLESGNTGLENFLKFTAQAGTTGVPQFTHSSGLLGAALHFVAQAGKTGSTALRDWAFGSTQAATSADRLATSGTAARGPIAGLSMAASSANDAFGRFRPVLESTAKNTDNTAASMRDLHIAFAQAGPPTDNLSSEMQSLHANVSRVGLTFPVVHHATDNLAVSMRDLHAAMSGAVPPTDNLRAEMRDLHAATGGETKAVNEAVKGGHKYTGVITKTTPAMWSMNTAVNAVHASILGLDNGILAVQGDTITWKQSLQAAKKQLDSNKAGLDGNSAAALANKQAVLQSTTEALALADQEAKTRDGIHKASGTIQDQINWLQGLHDKSKFVKDEIRALRAEEAKLKDISQHINVTGSGHWNVVQSNLAGPQPGKSVGGAQAAMASGGLIRAGAGPKADDVPVLASRGEYVVNAAAVNRYGTDLFHALNAQKLASGGVIGSFSGSIPGLTKWVRSEMGSTLHAIAASTAAAVLAGIRQASSKFGAAGPGGGAPAANAALARRMFPGENFAAWNYVAMRESGWNQFARNPSSGAYGIPQALPESKLPFAGQAAGGSNPAAQISWMEGYMRSRYGGAVGAAAHERAFNWYDDGGWLPPGPSLAVNNTGQPERVLKPGQPPSVALTQNGDVYIRDPVDWNIVSGKLSFAVTASGFG